MAIAQVSTTLQFPISSTANTGTVSSSITVPAGTDLVIVTVAGFQGTDNGHEKMTFTKGAADTQMIRARCGRSDSASFWQAALFYMLAPDIGSSKTLKWDWISTGTSGDSDQLFTVTFWSGVDTAYPIRAFAGAQGNSFPLTSSLLMSENGDTVFAWFGGYTSGAEGSVDTWTNASLLTQCTHQSDSDGAIATNAATGNQTVSVATKTSFVEGGLCVVALRPPDAASGIRQIGPIWTYCISSTANTGTAATDIYVPTGTDLVVVGVAGSQGTTLGLAAMTFTKGAADTAMTRVAGGDASILYWQAAAFYQVSPDAGFGTLKWDWVGSGVSGNSNFMFSVSFWKGVNTSTPVRSTSGAQGNSFPMTTGSLTAQTLDKIVAWFGGWNGGTEGSIDTWTNLTLMSNETGRAIGASFVTDGAWATADPTGNTTVSAATKTNFTEGGLVALVLEPAPVTVSVSVTGDGSTASVGTATVSVVASTAATGNSSTASVGTVTVSASGGGNTGQDNQREVGDVGMVGMGRFMGN